MNEQANEDETELDIRPWIIEQLGGLAEDKDIAKALEQNRMGFLGKLLEKKRRQVSKEDKAAIDRVLAERRVFMVPCKPPKRFRINGCGTSSVGRSDRDPSNGTYITTSVLTLLWIPILPLKQYVVSDAPGGGQYFYGRVPSSRVVKTWRLAMLGLLSALVIFIASMVVIENNQSDVWLVNGLPIPVTVTIGESTSNVGPGGKTRLEDFGKGTFDVSVKSENDVLEEERIEIPGGVDAVIYNVLGAAPVYSYNVVYTASPSPDYSPKTDQEFELHVGETLIIRDDTDFVFSQPPEEMRLSGDEEVRWAIAMEDGAWLRSAEMLANISESRKVQDLTRKIALLPRHDANSKNLAVDIHMRYARDGGLKLCEEILARNPDDIDIHRVRQDAMSSNGDREEVVRIYREFREKRGKSALTEYLECRVLPFAEALKRIDGLIADYPDDSHVQLLATWAFRGNGEWKKALDVIKRADKKNAAVVTRKPECLARLGRTEEALDASFAYARSLGDEVYFDAAVEWGLLVKRFGGENPKTPADYFFKRLPEDQRTPIGEALFACRLGDFDRAKELLGKISNLQEASMIKTWIALSEGPRQAIDHVTKSEPVALNALTAPALVILAGELQREGHSDLAAACLERVGYGVDLLKDKILGGQKDSPFLANLDREVRAALLLVSARGMPEGEARENKIKEAVAMESLERILHIVGENWK